MAQPTETKRALCPDCRRPLKLVLRVPHDVEFEDYKPGQVREMNSVFRSEDQGAVLLWIKTAKGYEEIMRDSASGPGPDGDASGDVECDEHGYRGVDDLCAYYESKL